MAKMISNAAFDASLAEIADNCDEFAILSGAPGTFYEACDPDVWLDTHVYGAGEVVHPVARDGNVYECTTGGTSGGGEPAWDTTPGQTTNDNTVVWTCRTNYNLLDITVTEGNGNGDYVIQDYGAGGRKLTVLEQLAQTCHTSDTATSWALLDKANRVLYTNGEATPRALTAAMDYDVSEFDAVVLEDPV
ncbi:hypothetical protein KKF82_07755 [Patescibacteria group bacterium]|nr:hypothetical protein [Patescibacteria group bacterium]